MVETLAVVKKNARAHSFRDLAHEGEWCPHLFQSLDYITHPSDRSAVRKRHSSQSLSTPYRSECSTLVMLMHRALDSPFFRDSIVHRRLNDTAVGPGDAPLDAHLAPGDDLTTHPPLSGFSLSHPAGNENSKSLCGFSAFHSRQSNGLQAFKSAFGDHDDYRDQYPSRQGKHTIPLVLSLNRRKQMGSTHINQCPCRKSQQRPQSGPLYVAY